MRGFLDLGMHTEALTLAREFLRRDPLETSAFNAALDGLLVSEDRLTRWTRLVESAYARLPKRARRQAKSAIFNFYYSIREFEKAASFIPKRLSEPTAVLDVAFAIDTLVYLNRLKEARVWVRRVTRRENHSVDSWEGGVLLSRVAEFYAEVCDFEQAIRLLEPLRTHRGVAESAILGIVELRVAQGLRAIQEGLTALREMNASPDLDLAVMDSRR